MLKQAVQHIRTYCGPVHPEDDAILTIHLAMAVENVAMVMHAEAGRITARKSRLSRQIADGHAPSAQNARINDRQHHC